MIRLFVSPPVRGGGILVMAVALLAISGCATSGHATPGQDSPDAVLAEQAPVSPAETSAFQPAAVGSPLSPPLQDGADELIRDLSLPERSRTFGE